MIPWIQVYSNLPQHPKTTKLADELGLASAAMNPNVLAAGMVVSLWAWAIQNAHDGDLSGCSVRAIAEACQWKKKPEPLVKALQKAGFLDADMNLHDWDDYTVMCHDMQEESKIKHRERQRRYRERKKSVTPASPCNVTVTSHGDGSDGGGDASGCITVTEHLSPPGSSPYSPPLPPPLSLPQTPSLLPPYIPPQNPLLTPPHTVFSGGGDDARACAREDVEQFFQTRGLGMDAYFGTTPEVQMQVAALTQEIFARFTTRQPTQIDQAHVFRAVVEQTNSALGWDVRLNDSRKELLLYACEAAAKAGKPGDWNYIDGVLIRLHQRGIRTLEQAEDYDAGRDQDCGWPN